jgi:hypothetical protein
MTSRTEIAGRQAATRLFRDMLIAGVIYLGATIGGALAIKAYDPPQWIAALLAIAPIGPAFLMLGAQLRYTRSLDELHRRIHGEAALIAAIVIAFASLGYGMLESLADFPTVSLIWVFPAICVVWSLANLFVRQRYL